MVYRRRYKNQTAQNAYENACDCHYFGLSSADWVDCGVAKSLRAKIWFRAWEDVANCDYMN